MTTFLRCFRIGWTVSCGLACVLFCVLWVRSYRHYDFSTWIPDHTLASLRGKLLWDTPLAIMPMLGSSASLTPPMRFGTTTFKLDEIVLMPLDPRVAMYGQYALTIPTWAAVVGTAAIGAIPWIRFRFSLRTLLVAMTLIAVVLGIIVWMSRAG